MGPPRSRVVLTNNAPALIKSGDAFLRMGDYESAIENFTKALEAGPASVDAFYGRGIAHMQRGELDLAIADFDAAVRINPNFADGYYARGAAYRDKGDIAQTIADYGTAVALDPQDPEYVGSRGYAHFYSGDYNKAADDLSRAVELSADPYCIMFRYLARVRAKDGRASAELAQSVSSIRTQDWPFAAVELLAGKRTPEATLADARRPDEVAEAHFYVGQWQLGRGDASAAAAEFGIVVKTCPSSYIEYAIAAQELKIGKS